MYSAEWQATQLACAFAEPGSGLAFNCTPSGGSVIDFDPAIAMPAMPSIARRSGLRFIIAPSCGSDLDRLDHVAHVARGLPQRLHRLALAGSVPRPHPQVVRAASRREAEAELAERVAAGVVAELGAAPALTAIDRIRDFAHALP